MYMAISAVLYIYRLVIFHLTPLLEQIHRSKPITRKHLGISRSSSMLLITITCLIVSKLFGQDSLVQVGVYFLCSDHLHYRHFPLFSRPSPSNPSDASQAQDVKMATRTATASTSSPRLLTTSIPTPTSATSSSKVLTTTPTSLSTLWWNTNLPPAEQTPICPSYLVYATHHQKERSNLATPDALFTRKTWPEVRSLIAANRLDQFTRVPSELRQYRKWTEGVVREYGSMMRFILEERLGWGKEVGVSREGRFASKGNSILFRFTHVLIMYE
jgi:hypothetical protein